MRCICYVLQPVGEAVVGETMAVEIYFTNPLPIMLKDVTLRVEGLGLENVQKIAIG